MILSHYLFTSAELNRRIFIKDEIYAGTYLLRTRYRHIFIKDEIYAGAYLLRTRYRHIFIKDEI